VLAAIAGPSAALATSGADHMVTICHATNSDGNPYRLESVDIASTGELRGGHTGHAGPLWNATLKERHIAWGDIVPAYSWGSFAFDGLNLTPAGQAILDASCAIPGGQLAPEVADAVPATEATPADEPPPSAEPSQSFDPSIPGDGEVSIDGPFLTPTPSTTPSGAVLGATGVPVLTPPPTDVTGRGAASAGGGLPLLLLALAGLSSIALIVGRVPAARRS
jgi:hypothetical protein